MLLKILGDVLVSLSFDGSIVPYLSCWNFQTLCQFRILFKFHLKSRYFISLNVRQSKTSSILFRGCSHVINVSLETASEASDVY